MGDKFTVICPTMWMSDFIIKFLPHLISCDLISEILLINNNLKDTPPLPSDNLKLKMFTPENNIGVNLSWNTGVQCAENDKLCIINDDIMFDVKVFDYITNKLNSSIGMIGLNLSTQQKDYTLREVKCRPFGFACSFFIHKNSYYKIPDELRIYYGDDWLFQINKIFSKKNYVVEGLETEGEMSKTSNNFYNDLYHKEKEIYKNKLVDYITYEL